VSPLEDIWIEELVCFHSCQSGIFLRYPLGISWVSWGEKKSTQVFTLNKACGQGLYPTLQLLTQGKEGFSKKWE
jgi:hypothetical protein